MDRSMTKGKATMRGGTHPFRGLIGEVHMPLKRCDSHDLPSSHEEMFSFATTPSAGSDRGKFTACWSSNPAAPLGQSELWLKVKWKKVPGLMT
jgi:hypothetical protein